MMFKAIATYTNTQDGTVRVSGATSEGLLSKPMETPGTAGAFLLAEVIMSMGDYLDEDTCRFTPIFVLYDGKELQVTSFEVSTDSDDEGNLTNLKVVLS
jgi:hypothetical protein